MDLYHPLWLLVISTMTESWISVLLTASYQYSYDLSVKGEIVIIMNANITTVIESHLNVYILLLYSLIIFY
jgi:hypothetical protein